jgi:choline dehydrogenase-like flavoprotein
MPLAMTTNADGTLSRVGPNAIFPAMAHGGDAAFELRASALATSVDRDDALDAARVTGATVRDTLTGATSTITARVTVVCADTMRTPQLLWASGIRPEALGRYLNEHAFLVGTVIVDTAALGIEEIPVPRPGEWSTSSTWLPYSGAHQPFHGQIMQSPVVDDDGTRGYAVLLALYIPTELRAENRLEFSDTELDHAGMPRTTVRFDYSPVDLELIARAKAVQAEAASLLGDFDSERDATLLPAGSSLHFTGTVRMGAVDDGTSVCDTDGRVWGFDNLFVAGNGVVPTALACNSTLTGAITAVRAARAVGAVLEPAV